MKIWLDDRWEPGSGLGFTVCRSVDEARQMIIQSEKSGIPIELISCDYDLGEYVFQGGNGTSLLKWLAERGTYYPVNVHSTHVIGKVIMEDYIKSKWPKAEEKSDE